MPYITKEFLLKKNKTKFLFSGICFLLYGSLFSQDTLKINSSDRIYNWIFINEQDFANNNNPRASNDTSSNQSNKQKLPDIEFKPDIPKEYLLNKPDKPEMPNMNTSGFFPSTSGQFKNFKKSVHGSVTSESYGATLQNPFMMNEQYYQRLYLNLSFTLAGLPFNFNQFFTTESQTTYRSNGFRFSFDANRFKQNNLQDLKNQKHLLQKRTLSNQNKLKHLEAKERDLEQELRLLKSKLAARANDSLRAKSGKIPEVPDTSGLLQVRELNTPNLQDSLAQMSDSTLERIKKLEALLEEIRSKREFLKQQNLNDSLSINELKPKPPNDFLAKYEKILSIVKGVHRFGIGNVHPVYDDFTVMGIPVRGADIGWKNDGYFVDVSGGKALANDFFYMHRLEPRYTRNYFSGRLGKGNIDSSHVYVGYTHFKDPYNESIHINTPPLSNNILNVGGQLFITKYLVVGSKIATSYYEANHHHSGYSMILDSLIYPNQTQSLSGEAMESFVRVSPQDNLTITGKYRRISSGFRSLGNPFLLYNQAEREVMASKSFFNNKIMADVFYKMLTDNLNKVSENTNKTKGAGVTVASNFNKIPNFRFSHTPYEQGNNHPDPMFRMNNQVAVTTATVTYRKPLKNLMFFTLFNYSRSNMEINFEESTRLSVVTFSQDVMINNRWETNLSYYKTMSNKEIDTLNSKAVNLSVSYKPSFNWFLSLNLNNTSYDNGGFIKYVQFSAMYKTKHNINFTLQNTFGKAHKIWYIDNQNYWQGRFVVQWLW